jgi:bacteriorhodopsin
MISITEKTVSFTIYLSIFMQILTGILPIPALFIKTKKDDKVLKDVLKVETLVQFVEGLFYILVVFFAIQISSLATYRYFDWVITTPFMLLSTMIFMEWSNHKLMNSNEVKDNNEDNSDNTMIRFKDTVMKYKKLFITIGLLNFLMLFFGFLGETKQMSNIIAVILGFIPFVYMFYLMYDNFVKETPTRKTTKENKNLFNFMTFIWSLYGVAAFFPTNPKNVMYNFLDIIAKNFYGLFLSYKLYKVRIK